MDYEGHSDCLTEIVKYRPTFFQEGLDRANKQAYAHYHIVQKFTVLPEELSVKGEELGPTLKVIISSKIWDNHV